MNINHSKKPKIALLFWLLTLAWLVVCLFLSSQNGTETGRLSMGLSQAIIRVLKLPPDLLSDINRHLRTVAHVIVFFVLALLGGCASGVSFKNFRTAPLWPLVPCAAIAVLDEVRKAYIPGRHCSYPEAMLNVAGCAMGCAVSFLILMIYHQRTAHKNDTNKE
ncbi:MAG: VanZ family protein [Oscillospiraceae bacterium]|nr:VanZ family protein [Oscillospiraceae bacterium]